MLSSGFSAGYLNDYIGVKTSGMSGASIALSDEWSAIQMNPAGLADQIDQINISGTLHFNKTRLIPFSYPFDSTRFDLIYYRSVESESEEQITKNGSMGMVYQIFPKLTVGFCIYNSAENYSSWKNSYNINSNYYPNLESPEKSWFSDFRITDYHFAVGYKLSDRFKFGAGFFVEKSDLHMIFPGQIEFISEMVDSEYPGILSDNEYKGNGNGMGFNSGIIFNVTRGMDVGITYRNKVKILHEGRVHGLLYFNNVLSDTAVADMFSFNGDVDVINPMQIGLGFAYKPFSNTDVAFDIFWTKWDDAGNLDLKLEDSFPLIDDLVKIPLDFENTIKFSFGTSVDITKRIAVRAGWGYEPSPIPDKSIIPLFSEICDKFTMSFGGGYQLTPKFFIEGFWLFYITNYTDIEWIDSDEDSYMENVGRRWKNNSHKLGLGLKYEF